MTNLCTINFKSNFKKMESARAQPLPLTLVPLTLLYVFLFLWTITGLKLWKLPCNIWYYVREYLSTDEITIMRTWKPLCITFALVDITPEKNVCWFYFTFTSWQPTKQSLWDIASVSTDQKQIKLWNNDESLHIWCVDVWFPPGIILEKRVYI